MTTIKEIYELIDVKRQQKLMSSPGCKLSEARHVANLALIASGELHLDIHQRFIWHKEGVLPIARATVVAKPEIFGIWGGEPTSIVIQSRKSALEGMIVDKEGYCLRPMRAYATYPSNEGYVSDFDREGRDIASVVSALELKSFALDEPIMYLLPLLFGKLDIKVGNHFYANIALFSRHRQNSNRNPWEREYV